MIVTAGMAYPYSSRPPAERVHWASSLATAMQVVLPDDPMPVGAPTFPTLVARISHGRWVVECPSCHSAQIGDPDDPRFFCFDCKNTDHGGGWVRVHYPKPEVRAAMEETLLVRPLANQSWNPDETVRDLLNENEEHHHLVPTVPDAIADTGAGLPPKGL